MSRAPVFLLQILLVFQLLFAQSSSHSIIGKVFDSKTSNPLPAVNIVLKGTSIGTATDDNGWFKIDTIVQQNCDLSFTMIGYAEHNEILTLPLAKPLEIHLTQERIEMSTIVVTGTKTERYLKDVPVTTQVVNQDVINETGAVNLSEVLSEVTGIAIVENQFGYGIELSGFDSDHILVMVDGMKLIGRTNGQLDISQIPTEQIERIEIVKGASSALYGSEAMGGVVNIITKKPTSNFSTQVNAGIGSYGKAVGDISLFGGLFGVNTKFYISSQFYGGNAIYSESLWENGSEYNKNNIGLQIHKKTSTFGNIKIHFNNLMEKQIKDLGFFEDFSSNRRLTAYLEHQFNIKNFDCSTTLEHSNYNHLYERYVTSSSFKKSSDTTLDKLNKVEFSFSKNEEDWTLNGGFGYESESIDSDRIFGNYQYSSLSHYYLQHELNILPKVILLSGYRTDIHSIYGTYFSPKLSLMFKPEMISRIRISYGEGFRAPSFKELYLNYTVFDIGYRITGNTDLKPETSKSVNVDFERWHTNIYHGRINFFYNEISNLIDYISNGTEQETNLELWQTSNIRKARTQGVDLDLTYFLTDNIVWSVGYSILDTWDVDNESPINLKSKHKANSKLKITLMEKYHFNIRFQYFGERYYGEASVVDDGTIDYWLDHYILCHCSFNVKILNSLQMKFGINNITDVFDEVWGPMPGREWYFSLGYSFNNKKGE